MPGWAWGWSPCLPGASGASRFDFRLRPAIAGAKGDDGMELIIEGLSKQYGKQWALREVSLRLGPGLVGLVGPNGAGKTTLMRILATLLDRTAGQVSWNGLNPRTHGEQVRQTLGYLP